ncbi:MAG TPA: adenylate cyclase regulatory domain-containing protein [Solirubrobacteraceae bacterium]|nr:adenylate cyclase regulatory domain-containing protein [Solirubrobacteraceae bacterium]
MAGEAEFEAAGLLEGAQGAERRTRVALLEQLVESGYSFDEIRAALRDDRLALLPLERVLFRDDVYSAREISESAGVPLEFLERIQQAFGMPVADPDAKAFSEQGMAAAERIAQFRSFGLSEDGMVEVSRVIGQSMSRVAEAIRALINEALIPAAAASEADLGLRYAAVAHELVPHLAPMLNDAVTAHLIDQIRGDVVSRAELAAGRGLPGAREMAVGFADLVGFTRLGESRPADELGAVADRLADLTSRAVRPPVRLVKTIGDAAMLVSPDPDTLLDTTLALVESAEQQGEDFPQLKAGLAFGPVLPRGGDWYGHTVNLASRVSGIARPGSVLVTEPLSDAAGAQWAWSFAGERKLKNVREPVRVFRARREAPDGG